ncbi:Hpt domain-containing protein, partial [Streptomyces sp. DSM 41529]|nr:Hpt domain-containing protein [Streptomyces sp. DSM 41529]
HEQLALLLEQLQGQHPLDESRAQIEAVRSYRQQAASTGEVAQGTVEEDRAAQDPELLEIFLEEGFDIIDSSAAALARWQAEPQGRQEVETLLRDLHTLKGGARMVEIAPIGDLAHELEFLFEGLSAGLLQPSPVLFTLLQKSHDRLAQM